MPFTLAVPTTSGRRKSTGCILQRAKDAFFENHERETPPQQPPPESQDIDRNLLDVLYKNYDFVRQLSDIENHREPSRSTSRQQFFIPRSDPSFDRDSLNSASSATEDTSSIHWLSRHIQGFFGDIAEAFTMPKETLVDIQKDSPKLSAVALRRDLKRCCAALHPLLEIGAALQDIILWKNPMTTLLLSLVFFYSIVRGWTASLVLLLLLFQLSLNYLYTCRQVDFGLCFLPRRKVPLPHFDMTGAQIIFDIAKSVQGLLRLAADIFEKLNNLLMWRDVQVTFVFYSLVIYWLVLTTVFNTGTCLGMCAFTLGIRIFITTYLFDRFPKLRLRLDTYGYFHRNLPIGKEELLEKISETDLEQRGLSPAPSGRLQPPHKTSITFGFLPAKEKDPSCKSLDSMGFFKKREQYGSFSSLYGSQSQLSQASSDEGATDEIDLLMDTVVTWRHCILHERNRPFPKNIISGILYLTDTSLAFRPKNHSSGNSIPPMTLFHDIVSVKKVTTLRTVGLITGSRKALEIRLVNRRRSIQFLGLNDRDAFVEKMREMCRNEKAATHFVLDDNEEVE